MQAQQAPTTFLKKAVRLENDKFDLVFQQLKQSMVNKNLFSKMGTLLSWKFTQFVSKNLSIPKDQKELNEKLPIHKPRFQVFPQKIGYTWIGHSTAVISIGTDLNLIIDPVFSKRCSPYQWIGPQRFRRPACEVKELPKIDVVLVSHDHYDHLDEEALNNLQECFAPCFLAGLRSEDVLPKSSHMLLLDWMDRRAVTVRGQKLWVTFVPVCHWSQRGATDHCYRLWGGFVVELMNGKKIFYSGDTGYCPVFKQIGQRFGGFDLAILPIGAYEPRAILSPQHINPQEAVRIHLEIKSKKSVGVHWGTFPLGDEHWHAARQDLAKACQKAKLVPGEFITVDHGSQFFIDY